MKVSVFSGVAVMMLFSAGLAGAEQETDKILYENSFSTGKNIRASGSGVSFGLEKDAGGKSGNALKIDIHSDHADGKGWPQVVINFAEPVTIDLTASVEFDFHYTAAGDKIIAGIGSKPVAAARNYLFPLEQLKPGHWQKLRIPLSPAKGKSGTITGLAFFIHEARSSDKASISMLVRDFRIVSGGEIVAQTYSTLMPMATAPKQQLMDIEIPNLLVNPYLTEGGEQVPPRGWSFGGRAGTEKCFKYGESPQTGRAFEITGMKDRAVVLDQKGITIVSGEKYRLSGYIKASADFSGTGGVGLAFDRWHKFWGYKVQPDAVKTDWHYFETIFTPLPEQSNIARFVIYLHEGATGTLTIARPVLEALTPKGRELSKNMLANNDFAERYAQARAAGRLRGGPPSNDYELIWSDEFDGVAVDTTKWNVLDVKNYAESRKIVTSPECVSLNGKGLLEMTVFSRNNLIWQPYLTTHKKFAATFGYFECRARFHREDFVNFAFWLMPEGKMDYRDPVNTGMEIDIMECITPSQETISHTTHWYSEKIYRSGGTIGRRIPGLSEGFRHIGFEWTPDDYIFYIDGVESFRFNRKDHPIAAVDEGIRLNGALHADKRDELCSEAKKVLSRFEVDYVRVYQKKPVKNNP